MEFATFNLAIRMIEKNHSNLIFFYQHGFCLLAWNVLIPRLIFQVGLENALIECNELDAICSNRNRLWMMFECSKLPKNWPFRSMIFTAWSSQNFRAVWRNSEATYLQTRNNSLLGQNFSEQFTDAYTKL